MSTTDNSFNPLSIVLPRAYAINKAKQNGDNIKFTGHLAAQGNKLPDVANDLMASGLALHALWNEGTKKIKQYSEVAKSPVEVFELIRKDPDLLKRLYNPKIDPELGAQITELGFFKDTFLENKLKNNPVGKSILTLDKNCLDFEFTYKNKRINVGNKILKFFDKNAVINTGKDGVTKFVKGNKLATFTAKTMGRIPVLNIAFAIGLELPTLIKGISQGDFGQIGRSAVSITGTTLLSGIGGALLMSVLPPVGALVGTALGGWMGSIGSKAVGEFLFPKPDKIRDTEKMALELQKFNQPIIA